MDMLCVPAAVAAATLPSTEARVMVRMHVHLVLVVELVLLFVVIVVVVLVLVVDGVVPVVPVIIWLVLE